MRTITLLTDFGLRDPYAGIMKGVILSINPDTTIVDITHDVDPQDICEAAFLVEEYYRFFSPGTIHIAVVDPTVGSSRKPIILVKDDYFFIGPDNGIFTLIPGEIPEVYAIENPHFTLKETSSTFHGRDIFAPVAAHLAKGVAPSSFGRALTGSVCLADLLPVVEDGCLKGKIIRFDRFGNAISNIKVNILKDFLNGRSLEVHLGDMTFTALSKSYYESEFTCLAGSSGYLEFGYFEGNLGAAKRIAKGELVTVTVC